MSYWNTVGAAKTFTHPLHREWLADVDRSARVLDYGCGYGRTMAELSDLGFSRVVGADISSALLDRGRHDRPDLRFDLIASPPAVDRPAASFDMILLFAVLTCVPGDEDQRALVAEVRRLLAPGGLLYVSDLTLQTDERSLLRYARSPGPHGVFTTGDGAVCRHHEAGHLRQLLADFHLIDQRRIRVPTMNGHQAEGIQVLARA
ncbi:class I SAM-dependent methyltransferase [Actinoplanes rectilineatus]|uniref:class I SAM-dependent methyltransferase n=1 Tax=Actinoplanes rectilineatus TaxID=113571 RepID=UPI001FE045ED|nr:class I SAM-dependent methyltransferase [Actinoplanes rectilineatus]